MTINNFRLSRFMEQYAGHPSLSAVVSEARMIALATIGDRKDKSGQPLFLHALRVAERAAALPAQDDRRYTISIDTPQRTVGDAYVHPVDAYLVGMLHDVIEDSWMTEDALRLMFPDRVVDAVVILTHDPEVLTYAEYIDRICESGNRLAILVKLADNADNTDPDRMLKLEPEFIANLKARYEGVSAKLLTALTMPIKVAT